MNIDHHTPHRQQAIRALAGKIDEQDADEPTWADVFSVAVTILVIWLVVGIYYFTH